MTRSEHDRHIYYRGIVGGEGCSGTPHAFMDCLRYMRARKNKKKTKICKIFGHCKSGQNAKKRDNNIKCPTKREKKKKKTEQEAKYQDIMS